MPRSVLQGSGQGFGFAIGMVVAFGLVTYLTSKAFDAKMRSMAAGLEDWLIDQTDRLNSEAKPGNLPS